MTLWPTVKGVETSAGALAAIIKACPPHIHALATAPSDGDAFSLTAAVEAQLNVAGSGRVRSLPRGHRQLGHVVLAR